jgi:hypothetical protein
VSNERSRWQVGTYTRVRQRPRPPVSWRERVGLYEKQCEASLSAAVYRRKAIADGTYVEATWQWYDGNHMRCPHPTSRMHLDRSSMSMVGVCGVHSRVIARTGAFFPYIPPGPHCPQTCCRAREADA